MLQLLNGHKVMVKNDEVQELTERFAYFFRGVSLYKTLRQHWSSFLPDEMADGFYTNKYALKMANYLTGRGIAFMVELL